MERQDRACNNSRQPRERASLRAFDLARLTIDEAKNMAHLSIFCLPHDDLITEQPAAALCVTANWAE